MKKSTKTIIIVAVVLIVVIGALALAGVLTNSARKKSTYDFFKEAGITVTADSDGNAVYSFNKDNCKFDSILIDTYTIKGLKDGKVVYTTYRDIYAATTEKEIALLKANGIAYDCADPNAGSFWSSLVMPVIMLVLGVLVFMFLMRQMGGGKGAMDFGKTKARVTQNIKVRFTDVAGAEEEKEELEEVVEFLKNPRKFSALGAKIPKGVLLVGPPGTGKTLFAKAVAGEANVPFFSISGSDFVEMFVGVGASRVRDLFAMAKKSMPCIVFIDEIDAVGRQRGAGLGGGNDEREQTLNQLLVQMDGFEANDGIIIMAATNRADILDPALLRPGRFDRQIYVNMPDVRGREQILKVHSRNKPLAADVNFKVLARMTSGFSGADIANLMNEAAILAARNNEKAITNVDLYEAINKVMIGPQKKSRLVTETDKRITAYHESGHAILAKLLPNCDPVQEVSIIPRGMAAGYTMTRPDNDNNHLEKAKLLDDIVMTLGGRVAEELIIQDVSAGASNDISVVTDRARKMVTEWGMSEKIGPVNYGDNDQIFVGRDYQTRANYSESMAALIDSEIETIIKDAYKKATELLSANKSLLDVMARVLIENETIYQDEVDMIMAGKSAAEVGAYIEERQKHAATNPFARTSAKINAEEEAKTNASATPVNPTSSPDATETKPETPAETPTDDKPE
ncbi:MAG: ATP-dependent zinc metalloprotease FtsH [Candidatus Borkfalkiaceae bacterium]|nr:ATP-dependent zinc metalloprotease FtsH [Christensenellaceae bacterium]